ncbi:glycosyltransferase family 2 protein [Arthrobacter rhombi]|uniref:glycosyltransferase family 2 protein n=1 Tax=Arthrobacter rhombi TaxID=71253 RepID=UPI0031E405F7
MNTPLLSIIIPAKDQAPFIRDTMTSLLNQFDDPRALEVIFVDDGSSDGTGELVRAFADRLPGLKTLRNDEARGLATARNQGLDQATGAAIAFLDGDDWLAPGHLAYCLAELNRLEVDFVRVDHVRVTKGRRVIHRAPQARRNTALDPRQSVLPHTETTMIDYPFAWAGVFHRRLADAGMLHFPDGLFTAEDRPWIWKLHLQASSYAVLSSLGIMYRRGVATSLTQIYDRRQLDFARAFALSFEVVAADPEAERFWPKVIRQFMAVSCHHLSRSNQMTPDVKAELEQVITDTMATLPEPMLADAFTALDAKRRRVLLPLRPPHHLPTRSTTVLEGAR